jgi:hypothetical protein
MEVIERPNVKKPNAKKPNAKKPNAKKPNAEKPNAENNTNPTIFILAYFLQKNRSMV